MGANAAFTQEQYLRSEQEEEEEQDETYGDDRVLIEEDTRSVSSLSHAVVPVKNRHRTANAIDQMAEQLRLEHVTGSHNHPSHSSREKKVEYHPHQRQQQVGRTQRYVIPEFVDNSQEPEFKTVQVDPELRQMYRNIPIHEIVMPFPKGETTITLPLYPDTKGTRRKQSMRLVPCNSNLSSVASSLNTSPVGTPRGDFSHHERSDMKHSQPVPVAEPLLVNAVPGSLFQRLRLIIYYLLFSGDDGANGSKYGQCDLKALRFIDKIRFVIAGDSFVRDPNIVFYALLVILIKLMCMYLILTTVYYFIPWVKMQTCHFTLGNRCGKLELSSGQWFYCSSTLAMFNPRIKHQAAEVVEQDQHIGNAYGCRFDYYRYVEVLPQRSTSQKITADGVDVLTIDDARCLQSLMVAEQMNTMTEIEVKRKYGCTSIGKPAGEKGPFSNWFNFS
jgi:hypothetical protein